jgi:hypothetical protein
LFKILVSHYALPELRSFRTIIIEQVLEFLKNYNFEVEWFIYMPDKIKSNLKKNQKYKILDLHDYDNAVDLVRDVKPDIIYASAYPITTDMAIRLAGKHFKIPVVAEVVNQATVEDRLTKMIPTNISGFFQNSVSTDTNKNQKQFMRRGRFWINKYRFLVRTQIILKINFIKIIKDFFTTLSSHSTYKNINNVKYAVDYHFVEGNLLFNSLIKSGYNKSSLILTGSPVYDKVFQNLSHISPSTKNSKIRVLLLTHSMYEHGLWTRKQRDDLVKVLVTEISKHKDEMSLVVKIHPSSEILSDYEKLIHPIDSSVPIYQKEDIQEFLNNSDVVIVYSTSSGPIQALILKKPIIMINQNLAGDIMLERKIVAECTDPSKIISSIHQAISSNPATERKINEFVEDYIFKADGLAYERVGKAIIEIIKKSKH